MSTELRTRNRLSACAASVIERTASRCLTSRCLVLATAVHLLVVAAADAQDVNVHVSSSRGATALSTFIDAQANLIRGQGDFLLDVAIARRHHALAAEQEIKNSVEWVRAYFERKELNRAYREKYHPNYIQRYEKQQNLRNRLLLERPELATASDVTDDLNFMLDRLSNHTLAHQVIFGDESPNDKNGKLTPDDVHHLVLRDATGQGGAIVTFRAERGTPLEFDWPLVFREPVFNAARDEYETAKLALLDDFSDGAVEAASWTAIQQSIDHLSAELQRQYPPNRIEQDSQEFLVYHAATRFLKAKAGMVFQARLTADPVYLTDKYTFDGDSVLDLVRHMAEHGLRFAPPEGGGVGAYNRLYTMMRQVYLEYFESER